MYESCLNAGLATLQHCGYVWASDISSLEPSTIKLRQLSVNFAHPTHLRDLGSETGGQRATPWVSGSQTELESE